MSTNHENLVAAYRSIIHIVDGHNREGIRETPERAAKAMEFWTQGYKVDPLSFMKTFPADGASGIIYQTNIPFWSLCEHHIAPFFGLAHIAYIPSSRIIGLSKFSRLVDVYARRLQVQERIAVQVAGVLEAVLDPKGVAVILEARHTCMESRGVCKTGTVTQTSEMRRVFAEDGPAKAELMALLASSKEKF
tara:strand:- start:633 stop:1205 length:573 start_codon:yes stop_codon:yes gene_type:complete